MQKIVYRVMTLLCEIVTPLPIGTNLGLLHLLWMLLSGSLLNSRGAIIPGLSAVGLSVAAVRRAWAALGQGSWTVERLLERFAAVVKAEGHWQPHCYEGYQPVAVDVTGIWRPRLQGCPTSHYSAAAGKALPAIPIGLVARVGSVQGQRMGMPLAMVRADPTDPSPGAHNRRLIRQAVALNGSDDALVVDRGFSIALLQQEQASAWVARVAKNFTARRATPLAYRGRGRPATRGELVRPLARRRKGHCIPATPPDRVESWLEGTTKLRAEQWRGLVLPNASANSPTFQVVAIHDPRYAEPLLLTTPLAISAAALGALYHDRWPVEQLPLAAKQMLGAARQFVYAPESCQRWPELTLVAGALLTYAAATQPAVATGFWDRRPQPTSGRLRRALAHYLFPNNFLLPDRVREKASKTEQLPKGFFGQRGKNTTKVSDSACQNRLDRPSQAA